MVVIVNNINYLTLHDGTCLFADVEDDDDDEEVDLTEDENVLLTSPPHSVDSISGDILEGDEDPLGDQANPGEDGLDEKQPVSSATRLSFR